MSRKFPKCEDDCGTVWHAHDPYAMPHYPPVPHHHHAYPAPAAPPVVVVPYGAPQDAPKEDNGCCPPMPACCPGEKGERGMDGSRGERGPQGEQGVPGVKGDPGRDGEPGQRGPTGPKGEEGCPGPAGPKGCPGPAGADGRDGVDGADGAPGPKGDTGDTGATGPAGADGQDGAPGAPGAPGADGADGFSPTATVTSTATGATISITDVNGTTTATVINGSDGVDGLDGAPGADGQDGAQGIQGIQGPPGADGQDGAQGIQGIPGPAGADGADGAPGPQGPSGIISCTYDDVGNCYDVSAVLQDGSSKNMRLGGCVTLLACGYSGDPICATNATGTITEEAASNVFRIDLNYTVAGATLTSTVRLNDTIQSGTTSVSNVRFENGKMCYDVTTTGKLDHTNIYDKTQLPKTPEGCTSPLSGELMVTGLVLGSGQATQINKTAGGNVTAPGFTDIGGNNYNVNSDTNSYTDVVNPQLFGGVPGSDIGNNYGFIVDTFSQNTQTYTVCEEVCYYAPVEYQTTVDGTPIAGSGVDASGAPFSGTITDPLTGQTFSI